MHDHSHFDPVEVVVVGDGRRTASRKHKLFIDPVEIFDVRLGFQVGFHSDIDIFSHELSSTVSKYDQLILWRFFKFDYFELPIGAYKMLFIYWCIVIVS